MWQARCDRLFPRGAIAVWDTPDSAVYRVPRVEVESMAGLDPVLDMPLHGAEKALGPWRATSWDVIQSRPATVVRVTFENVPEALLLSSGVGQHLAQVMLPDRASSLRRAA